MISPMARPVAEAPAKTFGSLNYREFVDYMMREEISQEIKIFMRYFSKSIYFNTDFQNQKKALFEIKDNRNAILYVHNLYTKYVTSELNKLLIIFKEEWIKECFILNKYLDHFLSLKSDKEIWLLAYFLECSSWYEFVSVINPTKLGLPNNRTAEEYYYLLKLMIDNQRNQPQANNNSDNSDSQENNDSNSDDDSEDNSNNSDSDQEDNNDSGGSNEESPSEESNDQDNESDEGNESGTDNESNEDNESNSSEDNNDDLSDSNNQENNSQNSEQDSSENGNEDNNLSNDDEEFSIEDLIDFLKQYGVSNTDLDRMESSLEEMLECLSGAECNDSLNVNYISPYMFRKDNRDKNIEKYFKKISKYITNIESEMKIVKCDRTPSYHKYSWKTDARKDDIIYPGRQRINGGLTKKFRFSPVIFFDFSDSTQQINNCLNNLAYLFWQQGYTICLYNSHLVKVIEPSEQSFFCHSSGGGTNTLRSINEYFERTGGYTEGRNIYCITDGDEQYFNVLSAYNRTTIFKIDTTYNTYNGAYYRELSKVDLDKNNHMRVLKAKEF